MAVVVYACGDVQAEYVPAPDGVSSLHSNVAPVSVEVNVNDGAVEFVRPVGPPVMVVSGGVGAASTMTVPFISTGCTAHTNA